MVYDWKKSAADEPWEIERALIDPGADDYEEKMDVSDCAVILPSDIDKLVAPTISTMEQLIAKEPLIIDCLNLDQKWFAGVGTQKGSMNFLMGMKLIVLVKLGFAIVASICQTI